MKRTLFTTATIFTSSLLFAGLAVGSGMGSKSGGTMAGEGHMSGTAMGAESQHMAAQPLDENQIREMQKLLNQHGYSIGEPDGIIGPSTTAALRQFQLDNNLVNNGVANQETLRLLSPDPEKQEFFGLAPEYGEHKGMEKPEPGEMMEETPKTPEY